MCVGGAIVSLSCCVSVLYVGGLDNRSFPPQTPGSWKVTAQCPQGCFLLSLPLLGCLLVSSLGYPSVGGRVPIIIIITIMSPHPLLSSTPLFVLFFFSF